jgi:thymidylate synthase
MRIFSAETFADVYESILNDLLINPEYKVSPRGQLVHEIENGIFKISNPLSCLYENKVRGSQYKYIAGELLWYFSGSNDLDFIKKYSKFWEKLVNEDRSLNSAYGHLIFTKKNENKFNQWRWAYRSLIEDKDTRQAIMHFNLPEHQFIGNKDFVCTLNLLFQIRDNRLNLTTMMRSNDVILGLPMDIVFFVSLQLQMLKLIKVKYPEVELGAYTHIANSLHLYDRNFEIVKNMLAEKFESVEIPSIEQNLVNEFGKTTSDFNFAYNVIDNNYVIEENSIIGLLGWIFNNAR